MVAVVVLRQVFVVVEVACVAGGECDQNAAAQAIVEDKRKVEKQQLLRKEIKSRFVNASMIRFL